MVFRIIVGVLSILAAAFISLLLGVVKEEAMEALSQTGYTGVYITAAILLIISGILGIFLRKNKICRIASAGLLFVGSLISIIILISANNAASMVKMSINKLYPGGIGDLIGMAGFVSIITGILSIVLLILSFKKPKEVKS